MHIYKHLNAHGLTLALFLSVLLCFIFFGRSWSNSAQLANSFEVVNGLELFVASRALEQPDAGIAVPIILILCRCAVLHLIRRAQVLDNDFRAGVMLTFLS